MRRRLTAYLAASLLALPVPARNFDSLAPGKAGSFFLLEAPLVPADGPTVLTVSVFDLTKRKVDPFLADKMLKIDWRDPGLLSRFITERGKIVPRRVSGVCAKNQRALAKAIKRARHTALLPYGGHRTAMRNL